MNPDRLEQVLAALKQPFHPTDVYWRPGSLNSDKTKALALPYANLRAYQNRLDEVCGLDWAVTYTAWGERIICHLTIFGITRSSTGEPDSQAEKSEIAGTAVEAQAFKRACSMFSLGRYLYHLPTMWVAYDSASKQFTEQAKAKLAGVVALHYQRTVQSQNEESDSSSQADETTTTPAEADELAALRQQFDQLGGELYGDQWTQVRGHNVERMTDGRTRDPEALDAEQLQKLLTCLQQIKRKRRSSRKQVRQTT